MKLLLAVAAATTLAWAATPTEYTLSASQYLDHVKYLASEELQGRGTGTPGIETAAKYISAYFKRSGVSAPPRLKYLQPFGVTLNARLGARNTLELHTPKGTDKLKVKTDFIPFGFSSTGTFSGEIVFVGYGITAREYNYDDYAGLDVKDKIVAVLRHEPQEYDEKSIFAGRVYTEHAQIFSKATNAKLHGAKAVLFVNEASHHGGADQLEQFNAEAGPANAGIGFAQIHTIELDKLLTTAGHTAQEVVDAIDKDLKPRSFALPDSVNAKLEVDVARDRKTANNVVAYLPGETDEYVILGAHYDHLGLGGTSQSLAPALAGTPHHGADDNASGTAGVMELARYFASRPKLKRGLLFMTFAGEELGLLGSSFWANNPQLPIGKAVAMINMDMIGRIRDGKVTVGGVGTGSTLKETVAQAATKTNLKLEVGDQTGYGSSDHMSFTIKEVPVLFFFSGLHADYHKPSDTWDKINAASAVELLATVANVATALAQAQGRPAYVRATETRQPQAADPHQSGSDPGQISSSSGSGYGPYFGSIPDFDEPPTGIRFADVRDGSPAGKAGLKAKDIMVEFDGKPMGNLYDFTYALRSKQVGETVRVKVLRDGKPIEVSVLLEERR
jgi:Peptidase family M28/PDZ domain/PA domain